MTPRRVIAVAAVALALAAVGGWLHSRGGDARRHREPPSPPLTRSALPPDVQAFESEHYRIRSTAGEADTRRVVEAVESLHRAYTRMFPDTAARVRDVGKLGLVLYRDQAQFKRFNRSKSWAEAYYLAPDCHAYFGQGQANPYHWMLHEATHQLNDRLAAWPRRQWSNEALATYLGTSRIVGGRLLPGEIDPDTYPVWWLSRMGLSGSLDDDLAQQRIIPLRRLLEDPGPPDGSQVNRYYLGYWSLAHFLLRANGGEHAEAFRRVLQEGSTLEAFERHIGPVEQVQVAWYRYLRDDLFGGLGDNAVIVEF